MSSTAKKRSPSTRRAQKRSTTSQRPTTPKRRSSFISESASTVSGNLQQLCYRFVVIAIGAASIFALCAVLLTVVSDLTQIKLFSPDAILGDLGRDTGALLVQLFGASVVLFLAGLSLLGFKTLLAGRYSATNASIKDLFSFMLLQSLLSSIGAAWLGRVGGGRVGSIFVSPIIESIGPLGVTFVSLLAMAQFSITGIVVKSLARISRAAALSAWKILKEALLSQNLTSSLFVIIKRVFLFPLIMVKGAYKAIAWPCKSLLLFLQKLFSRKQQQASMQPSPFFATTPSVPHRRRTAKASATPVVTQKEETKRKPKRRILSAGNTDLQGTYARPSVELLEDGLGDTRHSTDENEREAIAQKITDTLAHFNVKGRVVGAHTGPVITLYEFKPEDGVKVGKIASLQDDLAMRLAAASVRIIAPIPGKETVGIEVPHRHREMVTLRGLFESEAYTESDASLPVAIGKDVCGGAVVIDVAAMPHLLIAGATGTGKSVCINSILLSLLQRCSPDELGLILIDPKILELSVYEDIPHLRVPVITESKRVRAVLNWAVKEMDKRYRLMQRFGVRNIDSYNDFVAGESPSEDETEGKVPESIELIEPEQSLGEEEDVSQLPVEVLQPLPKVVIVIDELADLMMQVGREIEELITRLAQKARAAGIHLIVATQRPSVDVITGLIKANFPARMSFRVSSRVDSRTILDSMGAERLLGKGDMLLRKPGAGPLERVHGAFVSDNDVKKFIANLKEKNGPPRYDERIIAMCEKAEREEEMGGHGGSFEAEELDAYYDHAVELVVSKGQASTSMIQRQFRIGYNRAARIIDQMEREGIVGPMDGAKAREVLMGAHGQEV